MALLALVVVAYLLGTAAFFVVACAVVGLALFELFTALASHGHRPVVPFAVAAGLAMLPAGYSSRAELVLVVLAATTAGALLAALRPSRGQTPAADAGWTVLGVAWIGGGGAAGVSILRLEPGGLALLIAYLLVVACDDIAAYFVGSRFGRHKMAPSISPAKSWEGFAGGLAGALVAGAIAGAVVDELTITQGVGIGIVCGLLAPIGDLVESLVKREIGIKDSGGLLPGHGGFLDRVDAMILCAPGVLVYLRIVIAP
ncbi:phosphatidate cytidylyltransferase [soil metagenome]